MCIFHPVLVAGVVFVFVVVAVAIWCCSFFPSSCNKKSVVVYLSVIYT